ncbi:MAG: class I SAM-dependent methyltransferase [bacterium]|nr:class I SAM-dependent methyltransferase [bacterium]
MESVRQHWENIYLQKDFEQLGWYQAEPAMELEWIGSPQEDQPLIDIGAGCAFLADQLAAKGFEQATFVDLSQAALDKIQARLGERAPKFRMVQGNILDLPLHGRYRFWHDRAALHFLTDPAQQQMYMNQVRKVLLPGGRVMLAGFAPDGPEQCSGLPVVRHSLQSLSALLGEEFSLIDQRPWLHRTPGGTEQRYLFTLWQRQP